MLTEETDNLFDEDPSVAPSGALTSDGARSFLGDPTVLFWLAEPANLYATGFYERCGFAKDEGEILVKALG
ncbi:hypothetical protein AB0323_12380 [Arthrobacter sp. NPDC080031]|uniref:hypothetical protein n=1 Tax=Arthrobacter sp. NPDC080031 TaxID=3155918 RepID=UPI00344CFB0C